KFRIGFAPDDWNWLKERAGRNSSLLKDLRTTGYLGFSEERKSLYERFRGRLLFPIHDAQGRSVGIGGRVIPGIPTSNESAKYLNTPETPLFSKHRLLYGLDLARPSIRHKKRVLVMEGYTDTIIAHQYGFTEAVAVLGTALGINHIQILSRLADQIYLVLDGDEPGQKRAAQVLELFVAEKVDVRILTLPEEDDPAEYLTDYGAKKFEELIQTRSNDALTHAFQLYTKGLDYTNIHQSEQALDKLLGLIASGTLKNGEKDFGTLSFREEKMLQQLAISFSISEDFLRRRLKEIRGKALHDAQMRERWQEMRDQEEETQNQILPASASAPTASAPSGPRVYNESEAYSDGEETFYEDSDLPESESAQIKAQASDLEDFTSEPSLLTRESFEEHADEVDWEIFGRINAWEKEIVEILLVWPGLLNEVRSHTTPERFLYVPAREFFLRMCEMADEGLEPTFEHVLSSFESQSMKSWLVQMEADNIWNRENKTEEQVRALLEPIMANFALFHLNSRKPQDLSVFNSARLNREQKIDLLDQLIQEAQRKNGIQPGKSWGKKSDASQASEEESDESQDFGDPESDF
nr:toprim domain-containing protein [Thermoguttaceae bacterium]